MRITSGFEVSSCTQSFPTFILFWIFRMLARKNKISRFFLNIQGWVPGFDSFHPVSLGAHTSAPLLVCLQDNEAVIIAHPIACLDF